MVDVMIRGVFGSMEESRRFQVHLANVRSWTSMPDGLLPGVAGWVSAGRLVWYQGQDPDYVAGFRRALLAWGAVPETIILSIPRHEDAPARALHTMLLRNPIG